MSKNSVSRRSANGAVGSEVKFAGNDKEKMYEPKHRRKLVRVLTVIAYLFSVSLAAIMLSLFYVFIYNPGKPGRENAQEEFAISHLNQGFGEESLSSVNDTELNLEREEPRALPVKGRLDSLWSESRDQPHFNLSGDLEKENKTVYQKMMTLLKTK